MFKLRAGCLRPETVIRLKKITGAVPKYNTAIVQTGKIDTSNNT
jgi:hypothetical protein